MVEPFFRFNEPITAGAEVTLGGSEGHHAASVRRVRIGERVSLVDGNGVRGRGFVTELSPKSLRIKIESVEQVEAPALVYGLVQALAKGDRDELAIQAATELGALEIYPWQAERSISRWDEQKSRKGVERWQTICDEASKQSLRARFAKVNSPLTTKQVSELGGTVLVLDPTASSSITEVELPQTGSILLVVGPEGGIAEGELELLDKAGAKRVHLGSGILRTSTAGVAALADLVGTSGAWS